MESAGGAKETIQRLPRIWMKRPKTRAKTRQNHKPKQKFRPTAANALVAVPEGAPTVHVAEAATTPAAPLVSALPPLMVTTPLGDRPSRKPVIR